MKQNIFKSKLAKLFFGLGCLSVISTSTLIACSNLDKNKTTTSSLENNQNENNVQEWENFLNNKAIDLILNSIFETPEQKQAYIESQQNIDTKKYLQTIAANRFYYSNSIPYSNGYSFLNNLPKPYKQAREFQDELFSKNWLWFLFHIKKFTFIIKPDINLFNESSEEATESLKRNSVQTGSFYKPSSNVFNEVVKLEVSNNLNKNQEELDEDYLQEFKIILLNDDGFIFFFDLNKSFNEDKSIKDTKVSLSSWIETLPKLPSLKNNLKQEFSLLTFSKFSERLRNNEIVSPIATDIFNEVYGGIPIKFTIADNELD